MWWQPWDALTDPRWCPNRFIYACHVCERPWPLVQFQKLVWGQSCYDNMVAAVGTCFTRLFLPNPRPCACILPLLESKYGQSMLLLCQLSRNGGQNRGCQWLPLTDTDSNMAHLKSERDMLTLELAFLFFAIIIIILSILNHCSTDDVDLMFTITLSLILPEQNVHSI